MAEEGDDEDFKVPAIVVPPDVFAEEDRPRPPSPAPVVPAPPSFIVNKDYPPCLVVFLMFSCLAFSAQWLSTVWPPLGFIGAMLVLVMMSEWERRARYTFGRMRQRAHFDPLNLVKLPIPNIPPNLEMEPPTPYIAPEEEKKRTDPAQILKQAQDTLSGGSQATEAGVKSSMELALINLLKASIDAKKASPSKDHKAQTVAG